MDKPDHVAVVRAGIDEIEQAAETVKFSIRAFIDALKRFLDFIGECEDQENHVATLTRFGQSLTLVGNDLVEAGNTTLSRLTDQSHKATSPTPQTRTPNTSKGTDSLPS